MTVHHLQGFLTHQIDSLSLGGRGGDGAPGDNGFPGRPGFSGTKGTPGESGQPGGMGEKYCLLFLCP